MSSIFLLHGEDTFSSTQKLNLYRDGFVQKYNTDPEIFEGKKLDLSQFETNLEAMPFLSEKRLLIVRNFLSQGKTDEQKRMAEALSRTPETTVLIFHESTRADKRLSLYKKLVKLANVEEFSTKTAGEISKWALDRAQKKGLKFSPSLATFFVNHCGSDLWRLDTELEKLSLLEEVTQETVEKVTTPSLSASVFKLTDSIAQKNIKPALHTLKTLQDSGEDMIKVFFMIVRHFRILIQTHDLLHNNETNSSIAKKLKQPPFVVSKGIQQSKNFTLKKLKQIYQELLEIDTGFKTGKIRIQSTDNRAYNLAIEKFIINCCK